MFEYTLLTPVLGIIGGVSYSIISIIFQFNIKKEMLEKGVEIPQKVPSLFGGLKPGNLLIGTAIG